MNALRELRIHAEALSFAIEQDPKFFASVVQYVKRLKELTAFPTSDLSQRELEIIAQKLSAFWDNWRPVDEWPAPRQTEDTQETVRDIASLVSQISSLRAEQFLELIPNQPESIGLSSSGQAVFIGHGRSRLWARVQVFVHNELGLPVVTYESESRVGESIVPVLEEMLAAASF